MVLRMLVVLLLIEACRCPQLSNVIQNGSHDMEYVTGRDTAARSKTQIKKDDPEKTYSIIKDQ